MADLGSIQWQNPNAGTQRIDRTQEVRGIYQALGAGKMVLDETLKSNLEGDVISELEEAVANVDVLDATTDGGPLWDPNGPEAYISNRFDKLQHVIKQGNTSQVTLAQNEITTLVAKAQLKYPWLADDLARRARRVVGASDEMQKLGLADAQQQAASANAQAQYDLALSQAYADVDEGGMGIPEYLHPNDPEFQRMWREGASYRAKADYMERESHLSALKGTHMASWWDRWAKEYSVGETSGLNYSLWQIKKKYNIDEYLNTATSSTPDQVLIENFKTTLPFIQEDLNGELAKIEAFKQSIPANVKNSDEYAAIEDTLASGVEQINLYKKLYEDVGAGIDGAETRLKSAMLLRNWTRLQGSSEEARAYSDFIQSNEMDFLLKAGEYYPTVTSITLKKFLQEGATSALGKTWPELVDPDSVLGTTFNASAESLQIPLDAPVDQVVSALNNRMQDDTNSWIVPTNTEEEQKVAALMTMQTFKGLWKEAKNVVSDTDPSWASRTLFGLAYPLSYLNERSDATGEVRERILPTLADPDTMEAVEIALADANIGQRQAFGRLAEKFYVDSGYDDRRQEVAREYRNTVIDGVNVSDLVKLHEVDLQEKGELRWVIDKDAVARAAKTRAVRQVGARVSGNNTRRQIEEELATMTNKWTKEVNQQIAIERMLNKAKAVDANSFVLEDEYLEFFLGNGPVGTNENAWVNVFKYTR